MTYPHFSVLLSVYWKESPDYLRVALKSIWDDQVLKPSEVILVKDGKLTPDLDAAIDELMIDIPLKVVALKQNLGLGLALNEGLKHCSYELIARMDTDDISKPERFIKQVEYMSQHPNTDVCGALIDEFLYTVDNVISQRKLPEDSDEIFKFGKFRCPINHPVVMFRKSAVMSVKGYQPFYLFEDYWLWCRMLNSGCVFHNLQESLLWFRLSPDMYKRRGGWKYALSELNFQKELYKIKYISLEQLITNSIKRLIVRIIPNYLRQILYRKIAR